METVVSFLVGVIIPFQILTTGRHKWKKPRIFNSHSPSHMGAAYANWRKWALWCFILYSANKHSASVKCMRERHNTGYPDKRGSQHQIFLVLLYYFNYLLDRYSNHYRLEIALSDSNFLWWAASQIHDILSWHLAGRSRKKKKKKTLAKGKSLF